MRVHGDTVGKHAAEHRAWAGMIQRCYNPKATKHARYGGRGIAVCQRWRDSYVAFLADMGRRPSSRHSLDRIDVNGNYEPGNCRWATATQQARNTRATSYATVGGVRRPLREWAEVAGIPCNTVRMRLVRGWTVERALSTPCARAGLLVEMQAQCDPRGDQRP